MIRGSIIHPARNRYADIKPLLEKSWGMSKFRTYKLAALMRNQKKAAEASENVIYGRNAHLSISSL